MKKVATRVTPAIRRPGSSLLESFPRLCSVAFLFSPLFLFLSVLSLHAQIPPMMNHQGKLLNKQNQPINATLTMTFSIYNVPTGGTPLWTETQSVTVSNGVYSVKMGSVVPLSTAAFSGSTVYLGTMISPDVTEMMPRATLTSVPYSFYSESLTSNGAIPIQAGGGGVNVSTFSTDGNLILAYGLSATTGTFSGNLGIGTASPSAALDVHGLGTLHVSGNVNPNTPTQGAWLGWNNLGGGGTGETDFINNEGGGGGGFAFINTNSSGVHLSTPAFISGSGRLGLGTTGPSELLDLEGSTANYGIRVAYGTTPADYLDLYNDGNAHLESYPAGTTLWINGDTNSPTILDYDGGTFTVGHGTMTVLGNGNVGIGTASPVANLQVVPGGSQNTVGFMVANTSGTLQMLDYLGVGGYNPISQTGDQGMIFYGGSGAGSGNLVIAPWSSSLSGIRMTGSGNVGIGTANPATELHMSSGTLTIDGNVPASIKAVGSIQIGSDATPCTSANAGALQYSAGTLSLCNGSAWTGLAIGATVPSGTVAFFTLTSCPSGWTAYTAAQGFYIVGAPNGVSTGTAVGTALSNGENRPTGVHNHTGSATAPTLEYTTYTGTSGTTARSAAVFTTNASCVSGCNLVAAAGTYAITAPGITINNSSGVAGTNAPYIQLLACQKN